ncbi:DUF551 domain-containing protein [Atlantibacter hermannii]|uniref:DUF551 domain-containing protein n=1 Tax=Atlantibacter hermannii TaxID=565 RepID=UPI002FE000A4
MSHAFDSKALALSRQVMGLIETPMHEAQLQAKIQNLFIDAMKFAAPAVQAEQTKRLIGWRTADYTEETSDPEMAKNWAAVVGVLPVFEGDINTRLQAEQLSGNTEQVEPVSDANKLGGWIPVSERMPGSRHAVLVGRWFGSEWTSKWATYVPGHPDAQDSGWLIPGASWTPTHWHELPAAPKQEAE